jgi:hypothetical protein
VFLAANAGSTVFDGGAGGITVIVGTPGEKSGGSTGSSCCCGAGGVGRAGGAGGVVVGGVGELFDGVVLFDGSAGGVGELFDGVVLFDGSAGGGGVGVKIWRDPGFEVRLCRTCAQATSDMTRAVTTLRLNSVNGNWGLRR